MQNVLLAGNGLDLYHNFPTSYANFINVVNFLNTNSNLEYKTVGDILSNSKLQEKDDKIKEYYKINKSIFDETPLLEDNVKELAERTKDNYWFAYLNNILKENAGWIDFEKEIAFVLGCFEELFEKGVDIIFKPEEPQKEKLEYILKHFNFYIECKSTRDISPFSYDRVNERFCKEEYLGSGICVVDKEKVAERLYNELLDLTIALKLYLKCFADEPSKLYKNDGKRIKLINNIQQVITFNYTNICETIYKKTVGCFHIHGNINKQIVLGINANETDNMMNSTNTFIEFKKYYQRSFYGTDNGYYERKEKIINSQKGYRLFVIGHSLDITDADIIKDFFIKAHEINIYYHNGVEKAKHIKNLVKMFGKTGFDSLKEHNKLKFLSLDDINDTLLAEKLSNESLNDAISTITIP